MNFPRFFFSGKLPKVLSASLPVFLFSIVSICAQGVTPPYEYSYNIQIADSLVIQNNYKAATRYYSNAFKAFGWKATQDDRYNAARAWAYAGRKDSALVILQYLASKSRYWNYPRFINDPAFSFLNHTHNFDELVSWFKANKEKYYPAINAEFYNTLDSIHIEGGQNKKRMAATIFARGNTSIVNEQVAQKQPVNLKKATALLDKYGWPNRDAVGDNGIYALTHLIKRSSRTDNKKYFNMMEQAMCKDIPNFNMPLVIALDSILVRDQQDRQYLTVFEQSYGMLSKERDSLVRKIYHDDSVNLIRVKQIIRTYDWPGPDVIGYEGDATLALVIQHADLASQETLLPLMRKAVSEGKATPMNLALLEDRVRTKNGKPQLYGSQLQQNLKTGKMEIAPIEDAGNVNERRASIGLNPIEEYAKMMGVSYAPDK
jgi:hypothetical protein